MIAGETMRWAVSPEVHIGETWPPRGAVSEDSGGRNEFRPREVRPILPDRKNCRPNVSSWGGSTIPLLHRRIEVQPALIISRS